MAADRHLPMVLWDVISGDAGGHVKPENRKADRVDRRLAEGQTGTRQVWFGSAVDPRGM